jgi:ureidoglycolate hydrolase
MDLSGSMRSFVSAAHQASGYKSGLMHSRLFPAAQTLESRANAPPNRVRSGHAY